MEMIMDEKFNKAVEMLLSHEGGYVTDINDPGGETNFGISKKSYPDLDIQNLSRDEAIEIYHRDWWERYRYCELTNETIAAKVFDFSVNMGPGAAHANLQLAVHQTTYGSIKIDGVMGPKTINAVNAHPEPDLLLAKYKLITIRHYADLNKPKYLRGWIYRALEDIVE